MDDKRIRPGVWFGVVGLLVVVAVVVFVLESRRPSRPPEPTPTPVPTAPQPPPEPTASAREQRAAARSPAAVEEVPYIEGLVYGEIDLREARELMPDNIYWERGAPTKDPDVLAARDEERRRRNEEYGKVLAGDASDDEVRAYYDYKKRVSEDYLQFSEFMARRHRESENKEFVGMLELAMKMHAEKLKQLPAELEDALARSREREKIREDWRRQQEEFGDLGEQPGEDEAE